MKTKLAVLAASLVAAMSLTSGAAADSLPGDEGVAFWPYETGVAMGTSETFVDLRDDGSYFDPSIQQRVGVASESSARRPCPERQLQGVSSRGPSGAASERYGLQVFVWEGCGNRSGIPFG